jgi:NAD(P)-dependent dehydrogenase (short-subunit alcohol dehydrogenase family)
VKPHPTAHTGIPVHAAAKGAINALTTAMAATYVGDRIRVNAVAPSVTRTVRRVRRDPRCRATTALCPVRLPSDRERDDQLGQVSQRCVEQPAASPVLAATDSVA